MTSIKVKKNSLEHLCANKVMTLTGIDDTMVEFTDFTGFEFPEYKKILAKAQNGNLVAIMQY